MVTVKNKLTNIQRELTTINLAIQKIVAVDIIDIKNVQHNSQLITHNELLKDLIHILDTAKEVLDMILCLPDYD